LSGFRNFHGGSFLVIDPRLGTGLVNVNASNISDEIHTTVCKLYDYSLDLLFWRTRKAANFRSIPCTADTKVNNIVQKLEGPPRSWVRHRLQLRRSPANNVGTPPPTT